MSTQLSGAIGMVIIAAAYALESFHVLPAGTGQNALSLVMTAFAFLHVPLKITNGSSATPTNQAVPLSRGAGPALPYTQDLQSK